MSFGDSSLTLVLSLIQKSGLEPYLEDWERRENVTERSSIVDVLGGAVGGVWSALWSTVTGSGTAEDEAAARAAAIEQQEQEFHAFVREQIICMLFFISLYLISYCIISRFKSKSDNDSLYSGDEDYFVYRISVWMCTVSLTISVGSIALLPFSVMGSELLQRYPDNYYLQWLSWSLINSLWNYVFTLSNLSLFVLLPFSYFFIESQGFNTKRKNGITQRVYEALAVCALFIFVILCLADIVLVLLSSSVSLLSITSVNLPLIYSCVSLFGVMLLLVSTPIGFAKMFGVVGRWAMTPIPDVDELTVERLEMLYSQQKKEKSGGHMANGLNNNFIKSGTVNGVRARSVPYYQLRSVTKSPSSVMNGFASGDNSRTDLSSYSFYSQANTTAKSVTSPLWIDASGDSGNFWNDDESDTLNTTMEMMQDSAPSGLAHKLDPKALFDGLTRFWVPLREKSLRWYQHVMQTIKYPVIILCMLVFTSISLLMVLTNALKLMLGYRNLPVYAQYMEIHTRHTFGMVGVVVESLTILYVMAASLVGVYSMPVISSLLPKKANTSMTSIIINCSLVLVLASALPVLANTLGITTFDLLGAYSSLEWLSNFKLVLAYNVLFMAASVLCILSQITGPVRKEIVKRLNQLRCVCPPPDVVDEHTEKVE